MYYLNDIATKGDERETCPRCQQHFVAGERIQQSYSSPHPERRRKTRGVEWTHIYCQPSKQGVDKQDADER